jgi:hypothetical protein
MLSVIDLSYKTTHTSQRQVVPHNNLRVPMKSGGSPYPRDQSGVSRVLKK